MKHKDFDAQIKSSLEQFETGYEPSTWDMLRQKMDGMMLEEEPAPVSEVDKAVFHKLQHVEMPYQPAHWDLLATKMAEAARLRRRLWIGKMAEAAIFLLLLINIDSLVDMGGSERARPANRSKSNLPQVDVQAKEQKHRQYAANVGQQIQSESTQQSAGFDPLSMQTGLNNQDISAGNYPGSDGSGLPGQSPETIPGNPETSFSMPDIFAFLAAPAPTLIKNATYFKTPAYPIKPARTNKMYAATFGTFNHNLIKIDGETRSANGYGGGIAVGYRKGKWAVEAGLAYTQASYQPKKEVEIYAGNLQDGYLGTYASNVDADVFSMPVKVTRRMAQMGRTNVHGVAGVTANVSMQKSYQYKTVSYGNGPSAQPGSHPNQQLQPQLTRKGTGLLEENGRLSGNVYATADAGVRIQRPIGKRFAAFVEPVYHQSLGQSGIGPKTNRINTFSVNAGVVASL